MIGVVAPDSARDSLEEFFELFKTPWEWCQEGAAYDVLLCCGTTPIPDNPAELVLLFHGGVHPDDAGLGLSAGRSLPEAVLQGPQGPIPLLGPACVVSTSAPQRSASGVEPMLDQVSGEALSRTMVTRCRPGWRLGFDLSEEIDRLRAGGQPSVHAGIPSLDRHVELLRRWMLQAGLPVVEIPPVPADAPFAVCLTHDIDHPVFRNHRGDHTMLGYLGRAMLGSPLDWVRGRTPLRSVLRNWCDVLRLPFVHLGLARDPWRAALVRYGQLERGLGSTFYAIPFRGRPGKAKPGTGQASAPARRAAGYDLPEIEPELRQLAAAGAEIGVHGIDAWADAGAGREEAARVAPIAGRDDLGIRMHWLHFDPMRSPRELEAAGFTYDSTCGFNETVGFRAGTAQVFRPSGTRRLRELPLIVMDTALFYPSYLHLTEKAARGVVAALVSHLSEAGGVLTVNWHDRSIAPERCWDGFHAWLIAELKRAGAWFVTARQAVGWFEGRRALRFAKVERSAHRLAVAVSGPGSGIQRGQWRLRVHRPGAAAPGYQDFSLTSDPVQVPLA